MSVLADFLSKRDVQAIENLQVIARQVVDGFCSGLHRSPNKGFSVEFREHRAYVAGDEIRHLDWKVFGKSDRFFIREYEEETNLRATLVLDASGSMGFGSRGQTKIEYARRLAACLSYLMLRQDDAVGLVLCDDRVRQYVPPRTRPSHLGVLLGALARARPGGETELGAVFHDLVERLPRRGLLIVLSDCFGSLPAFLAALAHLRHAHHEIVIFQVWDPAEFEFPFRHWTRFESLEDDAALLVDPLHFRRQYAENLRQYRAQLAEGCHRHRVDLVPLLTNRPHAEALAQYLTLRNRH